MVSEEQDLRVLGQFRENADPGLRSLVVKVDEEVVGEERQADNRGAHARPRRTVRVPH